ncbi:MAG: hypothetical protein RMM58_12770 [Chloroflexota bacterium]|nr:hypothetical protein [Dehalococcoidia bacterium]MDW8254742.1 hypothetical protein [Chloroflexota bacterium]
MLRDLRPLGLAGGIVWLGFLGLGTLATMWSDLQRDVGWLDEAAFRELQRTLIAEQATVGYTDYWLTSVPIFLSEGELVFTQYQPGLPGSRGSLTGTHR